MFGKEKKKEPVAVVVEVKLGQEEIRTMPSQFFVKAAAGLGKKTKLIIIITAAVLVVGGGVVFFSINWSAAPAVNPAVNLPVNNNNVVIGNNENTNINETNTNQATNDNLNQPLNNFNSNINTNVNQPVNTNQPLNTNTNLTTALPDSVDVDGDGLTDVEEQLYSTDKNKPDTDGDSYLDGAEVRAGYSPVAGGGVKLEGSNLVKKYENNFVHYSILYPSPWEVKAIDESGLQIVFQPSQSKEFVEVITIDKVNSSLEDWYKSSIAKNANIPVIIKNLNGWLAIWSEDQLTVYLGQTGLDKIYIITYNPAGAAELNFRSTFAMMVNSFIKIK